MAAIATSFLPSPISVEFSTAHFCSPPTTTYFLSVHPRYSPKSRRLEITCCVSVKHLGDSAKAKNTEPIVPKDAIPGIRVVFAAGGTGGHISPALAIADELTSAEPTSQILFVGCPDSMESSAVSSAGFDFVDMPPARLVRPLFSLSNLLFPYGLIRSTRRCYKILHEFKPQIVIGTGGYVSFPVCLAAMILGIKFAIQEQGSFPGVANWVLSFFANRVFAAFNCTVDNFPHVVSPKCVVCGNPIRMALKPYVSKRTALVHFFGQKAGAVAEAKVVLVLGGSLGAHAINIALLNCYSQLLMEHEDWFIIWQTGVHAFDEMDSLVRTQPRLFLTAFLNSMDMAYAVADLIVSRAGAMTCSEILAMGKPSLLIPSPYTEEGHQVRNASLMKDVVGSIVITEDELDSTTLQTAIEGILGSDSLMLEMSERASKAGKPNAAWEIVKHILAMIKLPEPEAEQPENRVIE